MYNNLSKLNRKHLFAVIALTSCLLISCQKHYLDPEYDEDGWEEPIDPNPDVKIENEQRADGIDISSDIITDFDGSVYFYDRSKSFLFKKPITSTSFNNIGVSCFPLTFDFSIFGNILTAPTTNFQYVDVKSASLLDCSAITNYGGSSFQTQKRFKMATDQNGGLYIIFDDSRLYYKAPGSSTFTLATALLGELPQCEDVAVSPDGFMVYLKLPNGEVHMYGTRIPVVADYKFPTNAKAQSIAYDPIWHRVYMIDNYNRPRTCSSSESKWSEPILSFWLNCWGITAYDNNVYVTTTNNVYYTRPTVMNTWSVVF